MGWVTLTLRKTELKRTHSDYQKQLLDISREKRQMARKYHFMQTCTQNDQQHDLREIYAAYRTEADALRKQSSGLVPGSESYQHDYNSVQDQLALAKEEYERAKNDTQMYWEEELARIEEEANDIETALDQEQVQIEAQLEAITAEIESVGSAVSSQIQSSTIKLS